jgi:predicted AAA+ superfamily ATPase
MYVRRRLLDTLSHALQSFPAVLVTGPRQSGKTTFLRREVAPDWQYVSFDDPLERGFARDDPEGLLKRFGDRPVILDEVQYVPELFAYLKMHIDRAPEQTGRWLLTGSQQFELMHRVGESLAGRVALLDLLPFGRLEYPQPSLETAVWAGGYPIPALHPQRRDLWVRSYIRTYLERDVRQIVNVTNLRAFEQFVSVCAARHGQSFQKAAVARDCGISQPTVHAWAGVLEASYVVTLLPPYFSNFGKRLVKTPKLYFLDSALVCTLTRQPDADAALVGPMGGSLLEGWAVAEAHKVFAFLGRKPDIYYWRSHDGLEVDLIVQVGTRLHPVEIKLTSTPTAKHLEPLNRFKALAGEQAHGTGLLVCRIDRERPLPGNNLALPWHGFPSWLRGVLSSV